MASNLFWLWSHLLKVLHCYISIPIHVFIYPADAIKRIRAEATDAAIEKALICKLKNAHDTAGGRENRRKKPNGKYNAAYVL